MTALHSPSDALTIEGLARWIASPDAVLLQRPGKAVLFDRLALRAIEVDEEAAALFRSFSEPRSLPSSGPSQQAAMALRDAGFLIRPGEAEERRRRATARYSTPPESTIDTYRIVITEGCNLACTYCFEAEVAPDKKVMALDVLDRTVDAIVSRHPGGSLAVHWFGGEPLLRFGHIRRGVERFAGALMSGAVRSVHHAITTHGGLVDQERAEFLGRHRFSAYVSVDGDRDVNDINRLTRQGASTFDAAIRGYKTLSACGVDTGFLLTPHQTTLPRLARSVRFLIEDLDCRRIGINTPQPSPTGWGLDGFEFAQQMLLVTELCADRGVELAAPSQRILRGVRTGEPQIFDCRGPRGSMGVSIAPDGAMGYCIVSWNDERHRHPLDAPDSDERARRWKLAAHVTETCRTCVAEMVCGGPCPLEAQLCGLDESRCTFFRSFLEGAVLR